MPLSTSTSHWSPGPASLHGKSLLQGTRVPKLLLYSLPSTLMYTMECKSWWYLGTEESRVGEEAQVARCSVAITRPTKVRLGSAPTQRALLSRMELSGPGGGSFAYPVPQWGGQSCELEPPCTPRTKGHGYEGSWRW